MAQTMAALAGERRRARATQAAVATLLGMHRTELATLENQGGNVTPTREFAARFLDAVEAAASGTPTA